MCTINYGIENILLCERLTIITTIFVGTAKKIGLESPCCRFLCRFSLVNQATKLYPAIVLMNIWMDDYYKIRIYLQQISGQKFSAPIRKIQCNRLIYITLLFTIQMPNIPVNFLAAMMANTECAQNCHPMKEPYFLYNISHRKSGRAYQSGHADDVHQPESTYLCS